VIGAHRPQVGLTGADLGVELVDEVETRGKRGRPRLGDGEPGAPEITAAWALTLDAAYAAHPERFVRRPPTPPEVPTAVWINPPARQEVPTQ
jgi:hypothetical protein